jgi:hypothetical protein
MNGIIYTLALLSHRKKLFHKHIIRTESFLCTHLTWCLKTVLNICDLACIQIQIILIPVVGHLKTVRN